LRDTQLWLSTNGRRRRRALLGYRADAFTPFCDQQLRAFLPARRPMLLLKLSAIGSPRHFDRIVGRATYRLSLDLQRRRRRRRSVGRTVTRGRQRAIDSSRCSNESHAVAAAAAAMRRAHHQCNDSGARPTHTPIYTPPAAFALALFRPPRRFTPCRLDDDDISGRSSWVM